jgi:hypothetical protein
LSFSKFLETRERLREIVGSLGRAHDHYDPNQPRVPKGHPDGGQWTNDYHEVANSEFADQDNYRALSDLVPEDFWRPGAQYASRRVVGGRGGPPTPGQLARLEAARIRARDAIRRVHERDPTWEPQPSVYSTVEGQIAAAQATAREAEIYFQKLLDHSSGPQYGRSIPSRGPHRKFTSAERREIDRIFFEDGCSSCGTKNPGTRGGTPSPTINRQMPSSTTFESSVTARILRRANREFLSEGGKYWSRNKDCTRTA